MDDPEKRQKDLSGVWTLTIVGNASLELVSPVGITLGATRYDPSTNVLSAAITVGKGAYPAVQNLLIVRFTRTRATPGSPQGANGTGFSNLTVHRPGYGPGADAPRDDQLYTDDMMAVLGIFDHTRWMGATGTNSYNWRCAPPNAGACSIVRWDERVTPDTVLQSDKDFLLGGGGIMPFEHVLLAANELGKDVWINVPVTASAPTVCRTDPDGDHTACIEDPPESTFEYQLALLLRDGNAHTNHQGLRRELKIYIEHSNEVWNFGFKQYAINAAMAEWEVLNASGKPPGAPLDGTVPGRADIEARQHCTNHSAGSACWGKRRHARRVFEIGQTFERVFGAGSLHPDSGRVRMVYASWGNSGQFQTYFNDTLSWLAATHGPLDAWLYAISYAQYFGPHSQNEEGGKNGFNYSTATTPEVLAAFHNGTLAGIPLTLRMTSLAKAHGVKSMSYEGGPGYRVGGEKPGSAGLNRMIEAARDPGMAAAVKENVDTCWQYGWDSYNYFSAAGEYSGYGCWGATEEYADRNPGPPKLQALYELTGHHPAELDAWATGPRLRARRR